MTTCEVRRTGLRVGGEERRGGTTNTPLEVPAQRSHRQLAACPNEQTPDPNAGAALVFPARLGEMMACGALVCRRGNSAASRETTNGHFSPNQWSSPCKDIRSNQFSGNMDFIAFESYSISATDSERKTGVNSSFQGNDQLLRKSGREFGEWRDKTPRPP